MVILVLVARSLDGARIIHALSHTDLRLVLLAGLCTVVLNALRPLRWLWLLRSEAPDTTYRASLRSHLFATGARLVVPGQIGELGKALAVDIDPAKAAGLAAVDLGLDLVTTLVVAAAGASLILGPWPALLTLAVVTGLILVAPRLGRLLTVDSNNRVRRVLAAAWRAGQSVPRAALLKGLVLSFGLQALRVFQLLVLLAALGAAPTLMAAACLPGIQMADAFSFTVGRVGVREWLGAQVLPSFGLAPEVAVTAIFLQTMISNILPGLVGVAVVYGARRSALTQLKALGAQ